MIAMEFPRGHATTLDIRHIAAQLGISLEDYEHKKNSSEELPAKHHIQDQDLNDS